jgi:hypothetical protein
MQVPAIKETKSLGVEIPNDLAGLFNLQDNMEGVVPRLPQIKIIHRGQLYEMPDDSKIQEFEAIILDQHPANAFWEKDISESGGNATPDCFSMDGKYPLPDLERRQWENCSDCPQNQYGSDPKTGKGKACKNMKRLHLIMEGSLLPRRLTIPPTSISSFDLYMTDLVDMGLPFNTVITTFSLKKKEAGTFEFAEIILKKVRVLEKEELYKVAEFIKKFKEAAREQEIQADEYITEVKEEGVPGEGDIPF